MNQKYRWHAKKTSFVNGELNTNELYVYRRRPMQNIIRWIFRENSLFGFFFKCIFKINNIPCNFFYIHSFSNIHELPSRSCSLRHTMGHSASFISREGVGKKGKGNCHCVIPPEPSSLATTPPPPDRKCVHFKKNISSIS